MDINAWQSEHGGAAGTPEGPDSKGLVTHRATDGAWVVVDANGQMVSRGARPGVIDEQASSPPAAPTARTATRGGGTVARDPNEPIGSGDWLEKPDDFQAQGITVPSGFVVGTAAGQYYAHKQTHADGHTTIEWYVRGSGGGPGQPDPVAQSVPGPVSATQKEKWDKGEATAATAAGKDKVRSYPGTDPQTGLPAIVTEYADGSKDYDSKPAVTGAGAKPQIPPGGSSSTEGTPDPSKPGGWDNSRPREVIKDKSGTVIWSEELTGPNLAAWRANQQASQPQTGETRAAVPNRPGWTSITRKSAQGGNTIETTVYIGPDGKEVSALPAEAPKDTPTTKTVNGVTYVQHTTAGADGKSGEIYWTDQSGKRVELPKDQSAPGNAFTPDGPDAPPLGTTHEEIVRGLQTYSGYLAGQVNLYQTSGGKQGISPADATAKMEQRTKIGDELIKAQDSANSTSTMLRGQDITERGQTIEDTNARRNTASSIYNNTLSQFLPQIKYLAPGKGENMAAAMQATLDGGLAYANAFGGMQQAPPVGYGGFPALDQTRQGSSSVAVPPSAPVPPRTFDPTAGGQPTVAPAPAAAPQAPMLAPPPPVPQGPPPPAVNPVSQAPIPAPNRPTDAAASQIDNAIMPPQASSSGSPDEPMTVTSNGMAFTIKRSDWDSWSPEIRNQYQIAPATPPPATVPSPEQPQMIPFNPPENPTPGIPVGMTPRFVQQARYGQSFDPHAAAGELAARLGIAPEIMQQAVGNLYG